MAGYPVINADGVDILEVDGSITHYNVGDTVPISKLISRRFSWLVERGYLSDTETGFGDGGVGDLTDVEYIGFNTSSPYITVAQGQMSWNPNDGTVDLGLIGGNVTLQLGQEQQIRVKNTSGSTVTLGQAVYGSGSASSGSDYRTTVALAKADSESTSTRILGLASESITNNSEGFVTSFGLVSGVDTNSWTAGDSLYLSPSSAGSLTTTKPTGPDHLIFIGWVVKKAVSGSIFVNIQNGLELDELHDVKITSKADKDIITYDSGQGVWKNQSLATAIGDIDGAGSGIDADKLDGQHGSYYAPVDTPSFTGTATFNGPLDLVSTRITATINNIFVTTPVLLDSFAGATYRSAEYTVQLTQGSNYAVTKLLLIHNGVDVGITEYGVAEIGTTIPYTLSTNFTGGTLELLMSCSTANITAVDVKYSRVLNDV